jgi:3-oxoacyl-[acyl-carrier-protein] synthase-1
MNISSGMVDKERSRVAVLGGAQRSAAAAGQVASLLGADLPYYFAADRGDGRSGDLMKMVEEVVSEAVEMAGLTQAEQRNCALFVGSSSFDVPMDELRYQEAVNSGSAAPRLTLSPYASLTRHLRRRFRFTGGEYSFNTSCTSAINAFNAAAEAIECGRIDCAVVVGAEWFSRLALHGFESLQLLSREAYRPFDRNRDGLILGEGAAAVVLGRKNRTGSGGQAWQTVDFLAGHGNCDPDGLTCSSADSMQRAMAGVLSKAGLNPGDISLIKAQGTGTPANDAAEAAAMRAQFAASMPCFTFLKPLVGHTLGASGVLEMVLLLEKLLSGWIPPAPGFQSPDPEIGIEPLDRKRKFDGGLVMFNSFGFGGNNSSTILAVKA